MNETGEEHSPPWWEATPEGTEIPSALVRVERIRSFAEGQETEENQQKRQARFSAGIEYIARAFGAAEPLSWDDEGVTLVLGGGATETLPERAFLAAKEIWERSRIDLDVAVRVGAHVGHVRMGVYERPLESPDLAVCRILTASTPPATALLSEDVALALREVQRADLEPVGMMALGRVPAWVFPALPAEQKAQRAFTDDGQALWDAFRSYALGPEVRMLRYVGFRLQKKEPPALDIREVFEMPELEARSPRPTAGDSALRISFTAKQKGATDSEPVVRVAARELLARHRIVVVLGDPGSGKTTLLRWLSVMAAGGRFALGAQVGVFERLVPLPVSVAGLAELRAANTSVVSALARYFEARGVGDEHRLAAFLGEALKAGTCLLLLDGLDEVRAEERQAVHEWLADFVECHAHNRIVVTSRIVGYTGLSLPGAVEATIRPFDDAQVERYVRAFTSAYAQWEAGSEDSDDQGRGSLQAEQLIASLRSSNRLLALARNPFMLAALALVHRAEGRLPRHRVQAYELFARALCETWASARRLSAGTPADATIAYEEEALPILGQLALAMHLRYPAGVAPEAFVVETLAKALEDRQGSSGDEARKTARAFLDRAGREVQILLERGAGEWGFLHLTFQEFFTAAGLHALERFEEEALVHLLEPRWEEVLRLGVGYLALIQKRPEAARRFVQKVLEYEAPEPNGWVTSVLKKQVPLAALLAAEAGDALPEALKRRVAEAMAEWVSDAPSWERPRECLTELAPMDFGSSVEAALAQLLRSEAPEARKNAAEALGVLGAVDHVGELLAALGDADSSVRGAASRALSRQGPEGVRDLLEEAAKNSRPEVRAGALAALLHLLDEDDRIALVRQGLSDADDTVRHSFLDQLWCELPLTYWARTSAPLAELVFPTTRDVSPRVRKLAALFFGAAPFKSVEVQDQLLVMADADADIDVRIHAASAVAHVADHRVVEALFTLLLNPDTEEDWALVMADALAEHPLQDLVEHRLSVALDSPRPNDRARAIDLLARRETAPGNWQKFVEFTNDPAGEVRASAVYGLMELIQEQTAPKDEAEQKALAAMLMPFARSDSDPEVRGAATLTLCLLINEQTLSAIAVAANDPVASVRRAALEGLLFVASHAAPPVARAALTDTDPKVRGLAAEVLGNLANPDDIAALLRALPTTPAARQALWKVSERLHRGEPPPT